MVPPTVRVPTAKHMVALAQETPLSWLFVDPDGLGLVDTDQLLPFQRSASVFPTVPRK